ncbi:ATP-binding protein [Streptomyces sp. WAC 06783]|uniref:ATP-binding protein n=1 Tax=unclassified Streptomyces TaxID=2593676 RepID=UPI000F74BDA7|nr:MULTISPECIES: ATP-binding protein [unclassified Streptomyces]RSO06130.1 ATP-binding protein [Streptomyces sp. WAC 06783]RSO27775.1 ATP-binding protein [Streptomyces sp. WAC 06725]
MIERSLRPASATHRFPRNRRSPSQARRAFRDWAAAQKLGPATVEAGELLLGELASNAVLAATGPGRRIEVRFALGDDTLRIEVSDAGDGTPIIRSPQPLDEHGRGMVLVDALADDWGVTGRPGPGKTVWGALKVNGPDPLTSC